jgi:hypothetical protein
MDNAHRQFLSRALSSPARALADRVGDLLDRVVDHGTHLIPLIDQPAAQKGRGHLSAVALTYHAVEMLDSVSILLRQASTDPAQINLRSMMEAVFGVLYILESDQERRGLAYQVADAHARIDAHRRVDPKTPEGVKFRQAIAGDKSMGGFSFPPEDSTPKVQAIQKMLARSEFHAVEAEWQRLKSLPRWKQYNPPWHALFNGPETVRQLADRLGRPAWYRILYSSFSGEMHAGNALDIVHITADGAVAYQPFRYPLHLPERASLAVSLAMTLYTEVCRFYLGPEQVKGQLEWYATKVSPAFMGIAATKVVDADRMAAK